MAGLLTLSVRVLEVDERTAKSAILGLNRGSASNAGVDGGSVDRAVLLVRDDGLTQVEASAASLAESALKSWVCRRLALLEKLSVEVKEDLRLGLVGPALSAAVGAVAREQPGSGSWLSTCVAQTLTTQEVSGVIASVASGRVLNRRRSCWPSRAKR